MDRTVIRALLELSPIERLRVGPADSKTFREFEKQARRNAGLPELGIPRSMDVDELDHLYALREELDAGPGHEPVE